MKIGYDARLINETGVGRYIKNTLPYLINNKKNKWFILIRKQEKKYLENIVKNNSNVQVIEFNHRWHGFLEQLFLPKVLYPLKLDIFMTPYINTPVFYFKKKAVTIHDLTVLTNKTGRASTKNPIIYFIKRLGYKVALNSALKSNIIFTVTNTVKNDILLHFKKVDPAKIIVTYNGFTKLKVGKNLKVTNFAVGAKPYFFYVGNAHPHKNLEFLVNSFDKFCGIYKNYNLVICGQNDFFMKKIVKMLDNSVNKNNFYYFESPTDTELGILYSNCEAVVLPSLKEGFGLQILEAMTFNKPILCSRIPVYKEVSSNLATFFDPTSLKSFLIAAAKIIKLNKKQLSDLYKSYSVQLKKFSWKASATDTLHAIENKSFTTKKLIEKNY